MPKAGELDWTDFYNGERGEPEHSLSKKLNSNPNKGGEYVSKEDLAKEAQFIIDGFDNVRGPNKEEEFQFIANLFPHCAKTDEELAKMERDWDNSVNKNINRLNDAKVQVEPDQLDEFAKGKSFNDKLTREEILNRNMYVEG